MVMTLNPKARHLMRRPVTAVVGLLLTCLLTVPAAVQGQAEKSTEQPSIALNDIQWMGHFGGSKTDRHALFCLMGLGWLRAETSANFEQLIKGWLKQHPKAIVTPVYSTGPVSTRDLESRFTWVWLDDGPANINEYLVRRGGCSCITMKIGGPLTRTADGQSWDSGLLVSKTAYRRFLERVIKAEKQAREERLGIWHHE
jgi:hypothetical protein